jgi:hypothetical protein
MVFLHSVCQLLVTANVVPSLQILVTLMMEAICSSKTSVCTRATWHKTPEDGLLHSHHQENFKSYNDPDVYLNSLLPYRYISYFHIQILHKVVSVDFGRSTSFQPLEYK